MKISSQTTAVATGFYAKSQSRIFASQQVIPLLPKDILWDDGYESIGAALRQLATTKIRKIKLIAHGSHRSLTLGSVVSVEDLKQHLAEHNLANLLSGFEISLWSCFGGVKGGIGETFSELTGATVKSSTSELGLGIGLIHAGQDHLDRQLSNLPFSLHTNALGFDVVDNLNGTFGIINYYGTWHPLASENTVTEGALSLYTLKSGGDGSNPNDYTVEAYGQGGNIQNQTFLPTNPPKITGNIVIPSKVNGTTASTFIQGKNGQGKQEISDAGFKPGENFFFSKNTSDKTLYDNNSPDGINLTSGFQGTYGFQSIYIPTVAPGTYRSYYDGRGSWDNTQPIGANPITMIFRPTAGLAESLFTLTGSGKLIFGAAPKILIDSIDFDNGASKTDFVTTGKDVVINGTYSNVSTNDEKTIEVTVKNKSTNATQSFKETDSALDVKNNGKWVLTLPSQLDAAKYDIEASIVHDSTKHTTNQELNIVSASIESISDDNGVSTSDKKTSDQTLVFNGIFSSTTATGIKLSLKDSSDNFIFQDKDPTTKIGDDWAYDFTGTTLGFGTYTLSATVSDASGSATANQEIVIQSLPTAPVVTAIADDTGTPGDFVTTDTTLTVSGTFDKIAVPSKGNGTLNITLAGNTYFDGNTINPLTVNYSAGTWSFNSKTLAVGTYKIEAYTVDTNGLFNSSNKALTVIDDTDTTPPRAPTIDSIESDTGTAGDFKTIDTSIKIIGTYDSSDAVGGLKVDFNSKEYVLGTDSQLTTLGDNWNLTVPGVATTGAATVTATDAGGNSSDATQLITISPAPSVAVTSITTDTGTPGDFITNDESLTINGTFDAAKAAAGSFNVKFGGTTYTTTSGSELTNTGDNWSLVVPGKSTSGNAEATIIDGDGNQASANQAIVVDLTAPTAPAITSMVSDTGNKGDFKTLDPVTQISGTYNANDAKGGLKVEFGGKEYRLGTDSELTTSGDNWQLDVPGVTTTGTAKVTATDVAGNSSDATQLITIATLPSVALTSINTDSGTPGDFITNDESLTINGTFDAAKAAAGSFNVKFGGTTYTTTSGSELTNTGDNWSLVVPGKSTSGDAEATIIDGDGHQASAKQAIVVDLTAPTAPAIASMVSDTGNQGDFKTLDPVTKISGTYNPNDAKGGLKVEFGGKEYRLGTDSELTTSGDNWQLDVPGVTTTGTAKVTATDVAGNSSDATQLITIATLPSVALTSINTDSGTPGDFITNDESLTINGTFDAAKAAAGSFNVKFGGTTYTTTSGSELTNTGDNWSLVVPGMSTSGDAEATIIDGDGHQASAKQAIVVDLTAPTAPAIASMVSDTGNKGDFKTLDPVTQISGTYNANDAKGGLKVEFGGKEYRLGTDSELTTSGDNWQLDVPGVTTTGTAKVTATDVAGNSSDATQLITIATLPSVALTSINTDSGTPGDFITNDESLTINGTFDAAKAAAGSFNVKFGGTTYTTTSGSELTNTGDNWSLVVPGKSTSGDAEATIIDGDGHQASAKQAIVVDLTAPTAPAIASMVSDTGNKGDFKTLDPVTKISGTYNPNDAKGGLKVEFGGKEYRLGTDSELTTSGDNWQLDVPGVTTTGTAKVTATDVAGNSSDATQLITIATLPSVALTSINTDSGTPGDFITNDESLTINGTFDAAKAAAGSFNVKFGGTTYTTTSGSELTNTGDNWSLVVPGMSTSGDAEATIIDGDGHQASAKQAIVVDLTAPTAPAIASMVSDTGNKGDFKTLDPVTKISGTYNPNDAKGGLKVEFGGKEYRLGTDSELTTSGDNWQLDVPGVTTTGTAKVTATDVAGNSSDATQLITIATLPSVALTSINTDSGTPGDFITNDESLTINGTFDAAKAAAGSFNVKFGGTTYTTTSGSELTNTGDNWSLVVPGKSTSGDAEATIIDGDGHQASAKQAIVVDLTAPTAPAIASMVSDTGNKGDFKTLDPVTQISGTYNPNDAKGGLKVEFGGKEYRLGTDSELTTSGDNWQLDVPGVTTTGTAKVTATDVAGNSSDATQLITIATLPSVALTSINTDSGTPGDFITNDESLTINGTFDAAKAAAGSFNVKFGGTTYTTTSGSELTNTGDNWSLVVPGKSTSGDAEATIIDGDGHQASAKQAIVVDLTAPTAPAIASMVSDTGNQGDFKTLDPVTKISGTYNPNDAKGGLKVEFGGKEYRLGTDSELTTSGDNWQLDVPGVTTTGTAKVTATDVAGNSSDATQLITIATLPSVALTSINTDSGTPGDFITNDESLTINGTFDAAKAAAGSFNVKFGGTTYTTTSGSELTNTGDNWSLVVPGMSTSGDAEATIIDGDGHQASAKQAIVVDLTAPTAPAIASMVSDTGNQGDFKTLDPVTKISGTYNPNDAKGGLKVEFGGKEYRLGTDSELTTSGDNWQLDVPGVTTTGTAKVTATDVAGNSSDATQLITIATLPSVALTSINTDSGTPGDFITNDESLTINGTFDAAKAAAGSFNVKFGGTTYTTTSGSELTNTGDNWSLVVPGKSTSGDAEATIIDGDGHQASAKQAIVVDLTAPTAPAIASMVSDTGNKGDFKTLDPVTKISGTYNPNDAKGGLKVEFGGKEYRLGTDSELTTSGDNWQLDVPGVTTTGTAKVTATDVAGNSSDATQLITIATLPSVALTSINTDSGTPGDFITNDESLTINGTFDAAKAAAGSFNVKFGGTTYTTTSGSELTNTGDNWSLVVPGMSTSGDAEATIIDGDGHQASAKQAIVVDLTAPTAPAIASMVSDTGNKGDFKTLDPVTKISGTYNANDAKGGLKVEFGGKEYRLGTDSELTTSGDNWQLDVPGVTTTGTAKVTATDVAGNSSDATQLITIATLPSVALTSINTDSGTPGDFITNDESLTINGTFDAAKAAAGSFNVKFGGTTYTTTSGSELTNTGDNWSLVVPGKSTSGDAEATIIDGDGHQASAKQAIVVDLTAPTAPAIASMVSDTGNKGDFKTLDPVTQISGTYNPNDAKGGLKVEFGGKEYRLGTDSELTTSGDNWQLDVPGVTTTGTAKVTATDVAGNSSDATQLITIATLPSVALTSITTDSGTAGDFITNDESLTINGTFDAAKAAAGSFNVKFVGTTYTTTSGSELTNTGDNWSLVVPGKSTSGDAEATIIDGDGHQASAKQAIVVDLTAPPAPAIASMVSDTGNKGDFKTLDPVTQISGTYNPNDAKGGLKVEFGGKEYRLGTDSALTTSGDNWQLDVPGVATTSNAKVTATDVAGNSSDATQLITIATLPSVALTSINTDTGTAGDFITNDESLTINGTFDAAKAAAGSFNVKFGGTTYTTTSGSELTNTGDNWSLVVPGKSTSGDAEATIIDGDGHQASANQAIVVDLTAPPAPAITSMVSDTGTKGDFKTLDPVTQISGTYNPNDSKGGLKIEFGGKEYRLGTDSALTTSGDNWQLDVPGVATTSNAKVTATDIAGNSSDTIQMITIQSLDTNRNRRNFDGEGDTARKDKADTSTNNSTTLQNSARSTNNFDLFVTSKERILKGTAKLTKSMDMISEKTKSLLAEKGMTLSNKILSYNMAINKDHRDANFNLNLALIAPNLSLSRNDSKGLVYFQSNHLGNLKALNYNPLTQIGARYFDLNKDGVEDFVSLSQIDGKPGDQDGKLNNNTLNFSTIASKDLNPTFNLSKNNLINFADAADNTTPASFNLKATLTSGDDNIHSIGFVLLENSELSSADTILSDLSEIKSRSVNLLTSLEAESLEADLTLKNLFDFERNFQLLNGQSIRFFAIEDNDMSDINDLNDKRFSWLSQSVNSDGSLALSNGENLNLNLSSQSSPADVEDLVAQDQHISEVLDFSPFTQGEVLTGVARIARNAEFDSVIGFYRTVDNLGRVLSEDGALLLPSDAGYADAALLASNRVSELDNLTVDNNKTKDINFMISEFTHIAPYAIVEGESLFAFGAANKSNVSHFRTLGDNQFGFEDIIGKSSTGDYDDMVIGLTFNPLA
ncbi:hypothetical protein [Synechococcus sp. MIT S9504]